MIDLHSHVLPGIDDGPRTLDGALALARAAMATGTRRIAATPHVDHNYSPQPHEIRVAVMALNLMLRRAGIELEVVPGAEIAVTRLADLSDEALRRLRLSDGPYLLIESPHVSVAAGLEPAIRDLHARGYRVLLAHPERSPAFLREPRRLRRLVDDGALCSITAASLSGQFGRTVRRYALDMLREGVVHDIASDAHDTERRPPGLLSGLAAAEAALPGVSAQAAWLTEAAPTAILAGARLPPRPELRSGRLRRWSRAVARSA